MPVAAGCASDFAGVFCELMRPRTEFGVTVGDAETASAARGSTSCRASHSAATTNNARAYKSWRLVGLARVRHIRCDERGQLLEVLHQNVENALTRAANQLRHE